MQADFEIPEATAGMSERPGYLEARARMSGRLSNNSWRSALAANRLSTAVAGFGAAASTIVSILELT